MYDLWVSESSMVVPMSPHWVIFGDKWFGHDFLKILGDSEKWHFRRDIILGATRDINGNFLQHFRSHPESQIFARDLGNFEPRLAAKLGHFWRQVDWPEFPQNFGKLCKKMTFPTRHHFVR